MFNLNCTDFAGPLVVLIAALFAIRKDYIIEKDGKRTYSKSLFFVVIIALIGTYISLDNTSNKNSKSEELEANLNQLHLYHKQTHSLKNLQYQYEIEFALTDSAKKILGETCDDYLKIYNEQQIDSIFFDVFGKSLFTLKSHEEYLSIFLKPSQDSSKSKEHLNYFPNWDIEKKYYSFMNGCLICHYYIDNYFLQPS